MTDKREGPTALHALQGTDKALVFHDLFVQLERRDSEDLHDDMRDLLDDMDILTKALKTFEFEFQTWAMADPSKGDEKLLAELGVKQNGAYLLPMIRNYFDTIKLNARILSLHLSEK
ncbi:hypothetical protein SDC9_170721 [bioreactor metagenome]|uniref:Uncharacterized protein n=1 Tax=bioreactor metagenome TaxID=1076179 RepID=A0A645GHY3_9ZZZZ